MGSIQSNPLGQRFSSAFSSVFLRLIANGAPRPVRDKDTPYLPPSSAPVSHVTRVTLPPYSV